MRTPKKYNDNIKNGMITADMLADCLFSVNKRAKNCRDKESNYRGFRNDYYGNEEKYRQQKEKYYEQKEKMLALLKPTCIHREVYTRKERIYDYEGDYYEKIEVCECVRESRYYDREMRMYVEFADVLVEDERYYLFYNLSGHSFHTPICKSELNFYDDLKIINISSIISNGRTTNDLISTQFVNKLLDLITSGTYELVLKQEAT